MPDATAQRFDSDWGGAARLIARMTIWLGLALTAFGFGRAAMVVLENTRGVETLATIEASTTRRLGGGGWVELSWRDLAGDIRRAGGIEVSRNLSHKLRLGGSLSRSHLRIRYRPGPASTSTPPTLILVDDVPEHIKRAASLSIAGFLAISAGSLIMLGLLLWQRRTAAKFAAMQGGSG